jgi:hypothetical protein
MRVPRRSRAALSACGGSAEGALGRRGQREAQAPVSVVSSLRSTVKRVLRALQLDTFLLRWVADSNRAVVDVHESHERIDALYGALGVSEDEQLVDWRIPLHCDRLKHERWLEERLELSTDAMLFSGTPRKMNRWTHAPKKERWDALVTLRNWLKAWSMNGFVDDQVATSTGPKVSRELADLIKRMADRAFSYSEEHNEAVHPWYVPAEDIKRDNGKDNPFKEGMFGQVYKGTWVNEWEQTKIPVAIKQLIPLGGLDDNTRFSRELSTWSTLRHENILQILGANYVSHTKFFISKYATEGNVDDFFTKSEESEPTASWWKLFGQAAAVLQFLHENNVEHGDLKTTNLLVTREDDKLVAMVSDFGMAVVRTESVSVSYHARIETVRWKAPERLVQAPDAIDFRRADTYSLGVSIIDAATGEPPFGMLDDDEVISLKLNAEPIERPAEGFTDAEWDLVASMCENDPSKRPSLDVVIKTMEGLDSARRLAAATAA